MGGPLLALAGVGRTFPRGGTAVDALVHVDLAVAAGEWVSIMGPSGSGKSTLLGILGLLDRPTRGSYVLRGEDVTTLDDGARSRVRNRSIGFVFQSFHLIPELTVLENVETPLLYGDVPAAEWRARALTCLARVGLEHRVTHRPDELSGGEAQRAAVARALVCRPDVLLADEPTGNLDLATGEEVARLLARLHAEGTTIVLVTHNPELARRAGRVVHLRDGRVDREERT